MTHRGAIRVGAAIVLLTAASAVPASAQVDLSGWWARVGGTDNGYSREPVDLLGIPVSADGRAKALSYDLAALSATERQCQMYTPFYAFTGPFPLQFSIEQDPVTQKLVAWKIAGWIDRATLTYRFTRRGELLTVTGMLEDPVYLAEPYVLTSMFRLDPNASPLPLTACEPIEELPHLHENPEIVPHYLPGKNPWINELTENRNIPLEAVMGGPATMYPEFRKTMKDTYVAPERCADCGAPAGGRGAAPGGGRGAPPPAGGRGAAPPAGGRGQAQ